MRVKICGITRPEDAQAAEAAGASAIGLIFAEGSRRQVELEQAASISAAAGPLLGRVGVFVDAPLPFVREAVRRLRLSAVQLHGHEDADYTATLRSEVMVIRAVSFEPGLDVAALRAFPADAVLLDGLEPGSGERFDWAQAASLRGFPGLILAGGLTPANVASGIRSLAPYGVDVSSGVESAPGLKDAALIEDFVRAARGVNLSTFAPTYPQACG